MSVTITITDPADTNPEELQAIVTMLSTLGNLTTIHVTSDGGSHAGIAEFWATTPCLSEAEVTPVAEGVTPVPPAPPAPETPAFVPPPPPAAPGIELDKDGLPWDGRIHASTKTKTVEGVWKKKRSVEQATVDAVTAELRAVMAVPRLETRAGEGFAAATGVSFPHDPVPPAVAVPPPPPAIEAPAATAVIPPPPPPAAPGITFAEFMAHVTAGVTSQRFTREDVAGACVAHGIPNLPGLINRPDLIPAVARELGLVA